LNISLLGMNFLNQFDSFTFKNDSLILSYKK
jgi:predicted aspartyl protease